MFVAFPAAKGKLMTAGKGQVVRKGQRSKRWVWLALGGVALTYSFVMLGVPFWKGSHFWCDETLLAADAQALRHGQYKNYSIKCMHNIIYVDVRWKVH